VQQPENHSVSLKLDDITTCQSQVSTCHDEEHIRSFCVTSDCRHFVTYEFQRQKATHCIDLFILFVYSSSNDAVT
jgi:hypothetical protein